MRLSGIPGDLPHGETDDGAGRPVGVPDALYDHGQPRAAHEGRDCPGGAGRAAGGVDLPFGPPGRYGMPLRERAVSDTPGEHHQGKLPGGPEADQ